MLPVDMTLDPFPHAVLHGYWPEGWLYAAKGDVTRLLTGVHASNWQEFNNPRERKLAMTFAQARDLGAAAVWRFRETIADREFLTWLSDLTGIPGLEFDEKGGGVHAIPPGGYLAVHRDFNRDDQGRWRRINILVYLNDDWPSDNRGALHLVVPDRWYDGSALTARLIRPEFNTTVVFECNERSWHGHPVPTPPDRWRLSLAAYLFTRTPPPGVDPDAPAHDTIFLEA